MIFHIDLTKGTSDLQEKFSRYFPGLWLEINKNGHPLTEINAIDQKSIPPVLMRSLNKRNNIGIIEIMSWYTPARIIREFREKFGLHVQVYRKENGRLISTQFTKNHTLTELMELSYNNSSYTCNSKRQHVEYEYL